MLAVTTDPNEAGRDLDSLAGEYVLGTLTTAERTQLELQRRSDPRLDAAMVEWQEALLPLTDLAEPITPPARLWRRIESSLAWSPSEGAWWQRLWTSLAWWRGVTLGTACAAAILAALLITQAPQTAPNFMVVLVAPQDKAPGWVVQVSNDRQINLIPVGTFELPADKALQFWTKADGWQGPVSLGLIQPGKPVQIDWSRLPKIQDKQLFELTLEPLTGSPTNKPTGPIQFIGRAVPVA